MTKRYSRILVPYDGSKYSGRALNEALGIARQYGSDLCIITAVTTPSIEPPGMFFGMVRDTEAGRLLGEYTDMAYRRVERMLEEAAESCRRSGVNATCTVISDRPVKAILDFLRRNKVDLIVMGSQGLKGLRRLKALGSVSLRVLENADCPVMIVH